MLWPCTDVDEIAWPLAVNGEAVWLHSKVLRPRTYIRQGAPTSQYGLLFSMVRQHDPTQRYCVRVRSRQHDLLPSATGTEDHAPTLCGQ